MKPRKKRKKTGVGKIVPWGLLLCVVGAVAYNSLTTDTLSSVTQVQVVNEAHVDSLKVILGKTSTVTVNSRFSPILIFRAAGPQSSDFSGSGSLFTGSHGEQIVTSEHLFSKGSGERTYGYLGLREKGYLLHGIEKVLYTGKDMSGAAADITILGIGGPKPILGFSIHDAESHKVKVNVQSLVGATEPTSLVSGEKVRIIGKSQYVSDLDTTYFVIDYKSIPGESGSGFVDQYDNLYVLKATVIDGSEQWKLLGPTDGITYVYGPLKIN